MLSLAEEIAFILLVVVLGGLTAVGFRGIFALVRSGRAAPPREDVPRRLMSALVDVGLQRPIFRARPVLSTFHAFIFFGFSFYFLVNVADLFEGFIPGFTLAYGANGAGGLIGGIANLFNLVADILSVLTLVGMVAFLVRRFGMNDKRLSFNQGVLLHPGVTAGGVRRDSAIVGTFIMLHVGSRFLGQALRLAEAGRADPFMPFASLTSLAFGGLSEGALSLGVHLTWWTAIGLIVCFLPYFVFSKHIHLMVAPLNLGLIKPGPRGLLDPAVPKGAPDDMAPGAAQVQDLGWPRLLDAYACIMCNRCQEVCPAHGSGRPLSPAALEVNKRYLFNQNFRALAKGEQVELPLLAMAISPEAVWSCTTCYACVRVCPVGNEPMADIVDIRRRMIYDTAEIDSGIQGALEGIGKNGNWFGKAARTRARWAKDAGVPIKDATKEPVEYLWFVGDTASFDQRVVPLTQKVARVLSHAGVDFGILNNEERNAGNDVRRVGEEGLFEMLVEQNMKAFGKAQFKQIITTDPHSLNTLRNEYPQFGAEYPVHHYTAVLLELLEAGKLQVTEKLGRYLATYHDPCYLGRYNQGYEPPRRLLELAGLRFAEMPRNRENSYCCGAGGGQIWLGSTPAGERPAESRIREALATLGPLAGDAEQLLFVVSCPKDVVMYTDAVKTSGNEGKIVVRDIIEVLEEALGLAEPAGLPDAAQVPA
ncbi:(Fe-S)-binding protein [Oscillochloris sp. ZM17-4]|uniref:(Fe-S)-binding protein n=1 Tax=Oscillochloris sp. ZM17-4 TaxID=2866714 RepID=UPI001C72EFBE|nr:(Fe-S)-binding protein [Oscillochloris sp. ZM17-4]